MIKYVSLSLVAALLMTAGLLFVAAPDARAYCPPPCPGSGSSTGSEAAVQAATTGVQTLIQNITSGQLTIDHARTMAGEMEAMGNAAAAQQLRDTAAACEASAECVKKSEATAAAAAAGSTAEPTAEQAAVKQSLTTQSPLGSGDIGKPGAVFLAIIHQGQVFFMNSEGKFIQYVSGAVAPSVFNGTLSQDNLTNSASAALTEDMLAQLPPGSQVIAGYGVGSDGKQAFDSMINRASYNIVLTKK
jgi:hypothetical protein